MMYRQPERIVIDRNSKDWQGFLINNDPVNDDRGHHHEQQVIPGVVKARFTGHPLERLPGDGNYPIPFHQDMEDDYRNKDKTCPFVNGDSGKFRQANENEEHKYSRVKI